MKTLHLLTQVSLPEGFVCALTSYDAIVLLAEGVYQIHQGSDELANVQGATLYVIAEDLAVRGMDINQENIKTISYGDLPELLFKYDRNITW